MKNFNKIMQSIFKGIIRPKILFLFAFFFSSQAIAELSVTFYDSRIPAHNNSSCTSSDGFGDTLASDSTEDPLDVAFSTDGLIVYSANYDQRRRGQGNLSMNRLSKPFDMKSIRRDNGDLSCDVIDAFRVNEMTGGLLSHNRLRGMQVADNGTKFFISSEGGKIARFDLSIPNEFSTATFINVIATSTTEEKFALSTDGTKLFTIDRVANAPVITTYSLPGPFDISSITQIHQVDLTTIGVEDKTGDEYGRDIEFNDTGNAMFVLISNDTESSAGGPRPDNYIYQYSLEKNFDISTASVVGKYQVNDFGNVRAVREGTGAPRGFVFSADGMRIFITNVLQESPGVDHINSFQLECPYGLVACVSDPTASIGSQVELAKQNIALNISTIFKRFEWIKRNRDEEDLTSHNINLNYPNPLLEALAMNLEPKAKKTVASLVSKNQKNNKKSKWSSWSLGDIYIGNFEKLGFEKAKSIKAKGVTIGADRKFGENKFFGWAIRYGDNKSNIYSSQQNTEMESLTLNLYGITPTKDNKYINAVVGLSALRIDSIYLGKISGRRNGKQAFSTINFRTKNHYGKLNITPSGKLTYGITRLSDYTDFISMTVDGPTTDVIYDSDTFESGELAAGILFETEEFKTEWGTIRPMGAIDFFYDFTSDIHYNYSYSGSSEVNQDTITGAYSKRNLRTTIGFEAIYIDGYTLSPIYEKVSKIEEGKIRETISETFIIKLSRTKEENNSSFALNFDPFSDKPANLSYTKKVNGLDIKLNSNYFGFNNSVDYFTNFEISGTF